MAAGICSMELFLAQILLLLQQVMEGYRFSPTEEELVNYLKLKEPGCRESFCIIPTIENIYEINPSDLPAKFREKSIIPSNDREWWFICPPTQNPRISRKTPCGSSWKITGKHKDVIIDGKTIGSKTTLVFPDGRGSKGGKSNWAIHEYRLVTEDVNRNYVLCHLKDKRDEKADKSTTTSEHEVIDWVLLEEVESVLNQPNDDVAFPEHEIRAKMDSLMEPSQHQNRVQVSLHGLLQLLQRGLQSHNNSFPSTIHQFTNIGSPSVKDFLLDNSLTDISIELESSGTTKEDDEWIDALPNADLFYAKVQKGEEPRLEKVQQETAARNIEPCVSLDETAARAENGQISMTENRQSKIEPLDGVFPLEETGCVTQSTFNSSHFSEISPFCASWDESAAKAKGQGYEEHNLVGNSPKRRRLNMPWKNQIQ